MTTRNLLTTKKKSKTTAGEESEVPQKKRQRKGNFRTGKKSKVGGSRRTCQ